ncbi:MAG TPA: DUF445 domain-containing protein [Chakrabartia sp.]|nr:DUF445 domain-containing protein [Chakrabartia sp.]
MKPMGLVWMPGAASAQDVVRMKRRATGLLVVMALIFLASRWFVDVHPAVGFVKAFAEAGMVGGLADWFAVTALFRHPLGLPIPHTAIIPTNKDRIGDTLAQFLRANFLTPSVVARRMGQVDVAAALGRFLADPGDSGLGRLRGGVSRMLADALETLDDAQLGSSIKQGLTDRLLALEVSPMLGQAITAAMKEGRHIPLQTGLLERIGVILNQNEETIRALVHERSGRLLRWTGLDENVADAIINALYKLVFDMADNPLHPLRLRFDEAFESVAERLQHDSEMQARVAGWKAEIIANPAMQAWIGGLWVQGREALLRAARDPQRVMAGRIGDALRSLGSTLQSDPALSALVNRFARRATVGLVSNYGDGIVRLISDTVRSWDAEKITSRIEDAVGKDLQYIRINGTLVGGLVGLALHTLDVVL